MCAVQDEPELVLVQGKSDADAGLEVNSDLT